MLFVLISLALTLFSIFLYIAGFFRLTIPLLYSISKTIEITDAKANTFKHFSSVGRAPLF